MTASVPFPIVTLLYPQSAKTWRERAGINSARSRLDIHAESTYDDALLYVAAEELIRDNAP